MARNISTEVVRRFKGMDCWHSVDLVQPDAALDCLNVIPSSSGALEKLRYPVDKSAAVSDLVGEGNIVNFQNALGTRQVLAIFNGYFYAFDLDAWTATLIESNALNEGVISSVISNNIAFIANGLRMMKWTGTDYQNWGIAQPQAPARTIAAAEGVVDPTTAPGLSWYQNGSLPNRTYAVVYTWTLASGETEASPAATVTIPANNLCIVSIPVPAGVTGINVYVDTTGGTDYHRVNTEDWLGIPLATDGSTPYLFHEPPTLGFYYHEEDPEPPAANSTAEGIALVVGRQYRVAYGNSVTGHVGAASVASSSTGAVLITSDIQIVIANPEDTQCDQIWLFGTLDGGGDYFCIANPNSDDGSWPIDAGTTTTILDRFTDAELDKSRIAPMLNFPPVIGKYVCEWGGRIFVSGLVSGKQDIIFSGYDRIYMGRPEESFPPNNRIRLAIGSDEIAGHGVIQAGIVAFSKSNEMFMYRGTVTDRSTDAPIEYLADLEKLPWKTGCASHYSIASSPYGLIWLASDKTLKMFNGVDKPITLAGTIMPLLRRITPGEERDCRGVYYSFLERDWYLLLCSLDASETKNYILVVDVDPDPDSNVGAFPLYIQADAMEVIEDVNGTSHLIIMQGGMAKELLLNSDTTGGISLEYAATANDLPAHWRSGYFGGDSPQFMKIFRNGRLISDQMGFSVQHHLVDDDFRSPDVIPFEMLVGADFYVDAKSRRLSVEIQFPLPDTAANIQELSVAHIKTGER